MTRLMYARSLEPREASISQRIFSNPTASPSRSVSFRWAYSGTSVIAIPSTRFGDGGELRSREDTQAGRTCEPRHCGVTSDLFGSILTPARRGSVQLQVAPFALAPASPALRRTSDRGLAVSLADSTRLASRHGLGAIAVRTTRAVP